MTNRVLVNTEDQLDACVQAIEKSSIIVLDTETNGLRLYTDHHAIGIALYCDHNDTSYYIPFAHGVGTFEGTTKTQANARKVAATNERYKALDLKFNQLEPWIIWDKLEALLTPDKIYLCHNAQFDLTALLHHGIDLQGATVFDSMLAARTLYSGFIAENKTGKATTFTWFKMPDTGEREKGTTGLKWLSRLFGLVSTQEGVVGEELTLQGGLTHLKKMLGKGIVNLDIKKHLWALSPEVVHYYACMDVELTYQLHNVLLSHLHEWGQVDVMKLMCEHQINVAWRMNRTGFLIDHDRGTELLAEYEIERARLLEGVDFNINSANDIADYANENYIDLPRTPKGNPKTDKATLKEHVGNLPLLKNVLAVKALDKNIGTYIKKWIANTTPTTPLHPSFNVLGTVTGRWSSSDPVAGNLQNIPKDTKLKYSPKKLLLPTDPNKCMVEIDYSQLEMRVGAWVAETVVGQGQDMKLTNLILNGVDMHAYTRDSAGICEILLDGQSIDGYMVDVLNHDLGVSPEELERDFMSHARDVAKVPNFAAMYGGGWEALTNILENITETQARDIMDGWKATYPTVVRAMMVLSNQAMEWRAKPVDMRNMWDADQPTLSTPVHQYIQYPDLCVPFIRKWSYYSESEKQNKSKDAFNSIVQGTAGFITVESINRVLKDLPLLTAHATIHDSFVVSIPHTPLTLKRETARIVDIMTDWPINPPLACDVEISPVGKAWGYKAPLETI